MRKNLVVSIMAILLLIVILFCDKAYAAEVYMVRSDEPKSIGLQGRYIADATCYDESGFKIIDSYGKKWTINEKLNFNEHVVLIIRSNYTVDDDSDDWIEDILRSNPAEMCID